MSAAHRSRRPKGYMQWSPPPETQLIVEQARRVLAEYSSYGPMTVRQIFYRLVGNYGYDKTEPAYKRLAEYLVKARRSQMIHFSQIRDDGGSTAGGAGGYDSPDEFLEALARYSENYSLTQTLGQPYHVEVYCEAEGMVPMLGRMCEQFGVLVTGTGGFSSLTVTHGFAQRVIRRGRPTVLLHVGDFDPSGVSIFESMCQDIGAFVSASVDGYYDPDTGEVEKEDEETCEQVPWFIPRRIALTSEQVEEFDLPTAPPKSSDSRSANWIGETTQAEAMPPTLLEEVVTSAVAEWWDQDVADDLAATEEEQRDAIGSRVKDAIIEIKESLS